MYNFGYYCNVRMKVGFKMGMKIGNLEINVGKRDVGKIPNIGKWE